MAQKKTTVNQKNEQWIAEYRTRQPNYERLCLKLKSLLEDILSSKRIGYHMVEARAKSVSSFAEKLKREGKNYTKPFDEITDLAGLRIILYYVDDVETACNIVDEEFNVDKPRSVDKRLVLAPDQFGYLSVHKIVSLSDARARLPEWAGLNDLIAEIQIRTVLQHSWAAISHALQYKREVDVPNQFRRKLMRLSGLLELADEEFTELRKQQAMLRSDIAEKVSEGDLDISINSLSVQEFIEKARIIKELEKIATELGFEITTNDERDVSQLTQACHIAGITTIQQLENALNTIRSRARLYLREFLSLYEKSFSGIGIVVSGAHLACVILVGLQNKSSNINEIEIQLPWSEEYTRNAFKAGQKLIKKRG